jgi:NAD(P)H-dependent flavin oxidoreductase YrpB (nitropropane dioxygenase family)
MDASGPAPGQDGAESTADAPLAGRRFARRLDIAVPLIGGAMYPCSNPELVAAVSAAGGIGIVQPVSLTYVFGYGFRDGLRRILSLAGGKPVGMNALIEATSRTYHERMMRWVEVALEEGIRFFITSLGKPRWVVERVHTAGGLVYHDVTERKWAEKGLESGVDGLIAVNRRAGGHPGPREPRALLDELQGLGVPLICAGGIGAPEDFVSALQMGYDGVQMGTRFIATTECRASEAYKQAIVEADADDVVLTERITGVPVAVLRTPFIERTGTHAGWLARRMLRSRRTKHFMRTLYALRSTWQLKRAALDPAGAREYWQAGRSVAGVHGIEPVRVIVGRFAAALQAAQSTGITQERES